MATSLRVHSLQSLDAERAAFRFLSSPETLRYPAAKGRALEVKMDEEERKRSEQGLEEAQFKQKHCGAANIDGILHS